MYSPKITQLFPLLIPVTFTISELHRIRGVQLPEGRGARGAASLRFFMENLVGCSQESIDGGSHYQLYMELYTHQYTLEVQDQTKNGL